MNQPPLNPDALEVAARALLAVQQPDVSADYAWNAQFDDGREELRKEAAATVSAYLAAALPEVTSVDYLATAEGHYDAWMDSGDGYTQRKGWTLTCIWCRAEFTGATKREALQGYRGHEESILQKLREADAAERAKNRPEVKP